MDEIAKLEKIEVSQESAAVFIPADVGRVPGVIPVPENDPRAKSQPPKQLYECGGDGIGQSRLRSPDP